MAVVTYVGDGYSNQSASAQSPRALFAEAQDKNIYSKATIANGDSSGSLWYIGRVPSDARMLFHNSLILSSGITGLTSVSVGLALPADPLGGVSGLGSPPNPVVTAQSFTGGAITCLLNAADLHTATSAALGPATGSWNNLMWQIMGLSVDPGGYLDVIGKLGANAGGTGTLEAFLQYVRGGP